MNKARTLRRAAAATLFAAALGGAPLVSAETVSRPADASAPPFVRLAVDLMQDMAAESRIGARQIKAAYGDQAAHLTFRDRQHVSGELRKGTLRRLPSSPAFNLRPRLKGRSPIGEKDLDHQPLYVAARPEALGCLLHVASRVDSAPLEITSLVRHTKYQRLLARTNLNARTAVPTHAMGLAFDISIRNMPLDSARELRDVLRGLHAEGGLYFVAETRQLVFHVVPAPARREFYAAVYESLTALPVPGPLLRVPAPVRSAPAPSPELMVAGIGVFDDDPAAGTPGYRAIFAWLLVLALAGQAVSTVARRQARQPARRPPQSPA